MGRRMRVKGTLVKTLGGATYRISAAIRSNSARKWFVDLTTRSFRAPGSMPRLRNTSGLRTWWRRLATGQGLAPRLALTAAVLLLAAGLTWFWMERARLNEELAKANAELSEQQRLEREAANQLSAEREKSERLRTEIDRLAQRTSADPSDPASEPQKSILSFLLSPMLVRSGEGPQQISIPAGTDSVRLQMRARPEAGQRFQANLATVEGRQVWRGPATSARGGGGQSETVSATIPAGKLGPGDYVLTLSAGKAGSLEEINRYFFRVSR